MAVPLNLLPLSAFDGTHRLVKVATEAYANHYIQFRVKTAVPNLHFDITANGQDVAASSELVKFLKDCESIPDIQIEAAHIGRWAQNSGNFAEPAEKIVYEGTELKSTIKLEGFNIRERERFRLSKAYTTTSRSCLV